MDFLLFLLNFLGSIFFSSCFNLNVSAYMKNLIVSGQNFSLHSVFVATWNVGGKSPHSDLNLDDILQVHDESDIYVLGYAFSPSPAVSLYFRFYDN